MQSDFVIPLSRNDLLRPTGVNQYVVNEVLATYALPAKIQEGRLLFRSRGPHSIQPCFDAFYSVLSHGSDIDIAMKEEVWDLLIKGARTHSNQMVELLDSDMTSEQKHHELTTLKMMTYLLCQYMEYFESETSQPCVAPSGKGRKKAKHSDTTNINWEAERERGVRVLLHILQLNINRLWDPPVAEDDFINLVTNTCYKLLENPNVAKDKTTRDAIFHLLGVMIKKYNHGLSCSLKLIQLLQHFEHLAAPLAAAVEIFVNEFGNKTVAADIMREIGHMDAKELARDSSGTRAYAAFLVELAEKIPALMMPNISVLLCLLDGESYSMRNSILGVLAQMIVQVLSQDGLDDRQKSVRDQFLDRLEDHIHDVHAFVRSRVLQLWLTIVNEKALPLPRQRDLLELVIGRLEDKSSQVRKYAVMLLTAMLKSNPFAAKLPVEELRESYEKEKEKLKVLMPDQPAAEVAAAPPEPKEEEEQWKKMVKDVKKALKRAVLRADDEEEQEEEELITDQDTVSSISDKVINFLKEEDYDAAIKLLMAAQESWPVEPRFGAKLPMLNEEEDDEATTPTEQKLKHLYDALHKLFIGEKSEVEILAEACAVVESQETAPQDQTVVNEVSKQQVLVQYLKDSLNFVTQIQRAVPIVSQLLGSKNTTDVMEAIDFFVTGFEFGVNNAIVGIRRMLVLVWSKEPSIKEAVVEAYKRLYLRSTADNSKADAMAIVNNLTALTIGATVGDLTSLEQLVCEFVKTRELGPKVIQTLWERFAMKIPNTTAAESRAALTLLGMAAEAEVEIVRSNVDVLIKEGLGPRAENDFLLARNTCSVLTKLVEHKKVRGSDATKPYRLPKEHELFIRLTFLLVTGMRRVDQPFWVMMAERAVDVIYQIAEHPDAICGYIIKELAKIIVTCSEAEGEIPETEENNDSETPEKGSQEEEQSEKAAETPMDTNGDEAAEGTPSEEETPKGTCPAAILTRMLHVCGHVALRELVHIDVAVFGELKRRQNVQEREQEANKEMQAKDSKSKSRIGSVVGDKTKTEDLTAEEEMGMAGAAAEDAEAEFIRHITEREIVQGVNLLATFHPMIVAVCKDRKKYKDPDLRAAASLALAKYMLVSSEFCEEHLQLLFTILEKSPHATIRANTIIALGDLTFRFPNLIEPWTPNLYARLRDDSPKVRKNTLMVLTHLILNDMIKVKGQISELATCIVDDDQQIAGLAQLFFHELAKKGNAIYNIMPDMISRLSDPQVGVEEENFRTVMRYLFGFIQKDRQSESLVEKLCHRFRATIVERQWRDLAFCLSLLSFNEKGIRKLQENFGCFGDKMHEEDVYNAFITIINGARKFAKPEAKVMVDELEAKIEEVHMKGVDDEAVLQKATKAFAAHRKPKTPRRRQRSPRKALSEREQGSSPGDEGEFHPPRRGRKHKPKMSFSSDEDGDDEDRVFQRQPKRGAAPVSAESSDSENADPNIQENSPPPASVKRKPGKSVNAKQAVAPEPTPVRRGTRRKAKV